MTQHRRQQQEDDTVSDHIISLGAHWNSIQRFLIPDLEDEVGELDEPKRAFVEICERPSA